MDNYLGWGPGDAGAARLNDLDAKVTALEAYSKQPSTLTTTLNATTPIVSVTDSVDGMVDVEVGGATLNQVVENGDFSDGTAGWAGSNATLSVTNKVLSITGNGTANNPRAFLGGLKFAGLVKPFTKSRVRVTNANCVAISFYFGSATASPNAITTILNPVQNQWYDVNTALTNVNFSGDGVLFVSHNYADAATANGKVMEIDGNVGVLAIPITGTPYESMTADQINNIVGEYWEGPKSVERADVVSVGRNLLPTNESDWEQGQLVLGSPSASTNHIRTKGFYSIKPNQQLIASSASGFVLSALSHYDKNNNFIETTGASFTSKPNAVKVKAVYRKEPSAIITPADVAQLKPMLNEGSTVLSYQPYDGSKLSVRYNDRTKFDGALLPNGKYNEVNVARGYISAVKRVARYVLQSGDITSLVTTTTNVDQIEILKKLDMSIYNVSSSAISNAQTISFPNFIPIVGTSTDDASKVYSLFNWSNTIFRLIVPKGTYPNLAAAQAALAGQVIYYELATPIFIPYEDFGDYGIDVDGIISSSDDYTQFYLDNYNLLPPTPIVYPINLAASLKSLKDAIKSIRDWESNQELINLQFDARLVAGGH